MIVGIGCDLSEIARFGKFGQKEAFLRRVFTESELATLSGSDKRRAEHAAGLFAAKEAVAKALGTGFIGFGVRDIEICADENGKPEVHLTGGAAKRLRLIGGENARIYVSISHDGGMAMAMAVAERV